MKPDPRNKVADLIRVAKDYLQKDWQVIPIPARSKAPTIKDWQSLRVTEATAKTHFGRGSQNIGVLLGERSAWLTDVDLDSPEAILLAPYFLPTTSAIFGRSGKPNSHYLYYVVNAATRQLSTKEGMIVEIRSTGCQTVFPGSTHPSGEPVRWSSEGNPSSVLLEDLVESVQRLAAAVLLVRHWPGNGARHAAALTLSGALLEGGWSVPEAENFVEIVARYGGSENVASKVKTVESSRKRLTAGGHVSGLSALREFLPQDVKKKIQEWLCLKYPARSPNGACTDAANGQRLVRASDGNIAWISDSNSWWVYDERRWQQDKHGAVQKLCERVAHDIFAEIAEADTGSAVQLGKWAVASLSKQHLQAMEWAARPYLSQSYDGFDADPWLLNAANGTVDLRTGELRPHDRDDFITKLLPISYKPDAECPQWMEFLEHVMASDKEVVSFIQTAVGYTLTGNVNEQCFFILHGTGANGKSVFLEVLQNLLGDFGRPIEMRALLQKRSVSEAVRNDLAALRGTRLAVASEANREVRLDEALIKSLTGSDKITARFLYQEFFDFYPTFKIWIAVNHLPGIRGDDDAIWRRVRLVPFAVTIPTQNQIRELATRLLREEATGILAWAVRGSLQWQKDGLPVPRAIRDAIATYRSSNDPIGEFLAARTLNSTTISWRKPEGWVRCGELYQAYCDWASSIGDEPESAKQLGLAMKARGFRTDQKWIGGQNQKIYVGVELVRRGDEGATDVHFQEFE